MHLIVLKRGVAGRQRYMAAFEYLESYLWRREQTGSVDTQGQKVGGKHSRRV